MAIAACGIAGSSSGDCGRHQDQQNTSDQDLHLRASYQKITAKTKKMKMAQTNARRIRSTKEFLRARIN
jgi:hypothetical protein